LSNDEKKVPYCFSFGTDVVNERLEGSQEVRIYNSVFNKVLEGLGLAFIIPCYSDAQLKLYSFLASLRGYEAKGGEMLRTSTIMRIPDPWFVWKGFAVADGFQLEHFPDV